MAIVHTEALVLRSQRLGETSLIVALFTREHGLLRCVAKGARGPKSRLGASLEPGVLLNAIVYRTITRELHLLSKADIVGCWPSLWEDPVRFVHAGAVLEFLERAAYGESAEGALLDLACDTLSALAHAPIPALEAMIRGFELRACERLGLAPELGACLECRRPLTRGGVFHPVRGGLLCGERCGADGSAFRVSEKARRTLVALAEQAPGSVAGWAIDRYPAPEIARTVERFLMAHLERFTGLRALRVGESMARYAADRGATA